MNYNSHSFDQGSFWCGSDAFQTLRSMLPLSMSNTSSSTVSVPSVMEGRILPQDTPRRSRDSYQSTANGDVVLVQPSFDENSSMGRSKPSISSAKSNEWQSRSPKGETNDSDSERRNPASPPEAQSNIDQQRRRTDARHARNLSAHFFDATTISVDVPHHSKDPDEDDAANRKHRRMFSGDVSNPRTTHRRLNSLGSAALVARHQREDSGGLDILSAVADATKSELANAVGTNSTGSSRPPPCWDAPLPEMRPRSSMASMPAGPSFGQSPAQPQLAQPPSYCPPVDTRHHQMNPPPDRRNTAGNAPYPQQQHPSYNMYPPQPTPTSSYHQSFPPPPPAYYHHPYSHSRGMHSQGAYPVQYAPPRPGSSYAYPGQDSRSFDQKSAGLATQWEHAQPPPPPQSPVHVPLGTSANQGSQTFVTAISVGHGNKTLPVNTSRKTVSTNTEVPPEQRNASVPSEVGHHRKMSSFSSLGTILGSSIFSPNPPSASEGDSAGKLKGHHRVTSSSVSFLQGIDVGLEMTDATFLRNLHASNSKVDHPPSSPAMASVRQVAPSTATEETESGGTRLAAGGTSKRIRRKCAVGGCSNRVVQGGLCISHGAKRKTCKYPGCEKNVKKAGLCSTHGPARKRCEHPGCGKVAVQGGRCISHGAKKKLCSMDACTKQAILGGMCKKHHDQVTSTKKSGGGTSSRSLYCMEVPSAGPSARKPAHKPTHTRGLSIFQEMSADAVSSILNDEKAGANTSRSGASSAGGSSTEMW